VCEWGRPSVPTGAVALAALVQIGSRRLSAISFNQSPPLPRVTATPPTHPSTNPATHPTNESEWRGLGEVRGFRVGGPGGCAKVSVPKLLPLEVFRVFSCCEFLLGTLSEGEWTIARNSCSFRPSHGTDCVVGGTGGSLWRWGMEGVVRGRGRQKGFVRGLREGGAPGWQRGSGRPPLCQGTPRRGRKWGQTFFGLTSEWRGGMGFGFGLQFEKRVGRGVCSSFSIATEFPFPSYILKYAALKTTRAMAKFCSPMFLVYFSSVLFYTFLNEVPT